MLVDGMLRSKFIFIYIYRVELWNTADIPSSKLLEAVVASAAVRSAF